MGDGETFTGEAYSKQKQIFFFHNFLWLQVASNKQKRKKKKDKVHTQTKIGILQYELLNDYMKHYNKKKKLQHQIISWLTANSPVEWIS